MPFPRALYIAVQTRVPCLVWGAPGIGKSSSIEGLAQYLKWYLETVIASLRDPTDFAGLPFISEGSVKIAPPRWATNLIDASKRKQIPLWFIDEITTCPPAVQAALLRAVVSRVVGDTKLPDETRILAAANPPEEAAAGYDLSAPMANRFAHFTWTVYPEDAAVWGEMLVKDFKNVIPKDFPKLSADWRNKWEQAAADIRDFLTASPDNGKLLHMLPASEAERGRAWPSPRTWSYATEFYTAWLSLYDKVEGEAEKSLQDLLRSALGNMTIVGAFIKFLHERHSFDPEVVIADPKKFKLNKDAALNASNLKLIGEALVGRFVAATDASGKAEEGQQPDTHIPPTIPLTDERLRLGGKIEVQLTLQNQNVVGTYKTIWETLDKALLVPLYQQVLRGIFTLSMADEKNGVATFERQLKLLSEVFDKANTDKFGAKAKGLSNFNLDSFACRDHLLKAAHDLGYEEVKEEGKPAGTTGSHVTTASPKVVGTIPAPHGKGMIAATEY